MEKIPERVFELLSSYDLEMVQLGATLLHSYTTQTKCKEILEEYRLPKKEDKKLDKTGPSTYLLDSYDITFSHSPKWDYNIVEGDIYIVAIDPVNMSIWSQMTNSYKHTYTPQNFSLTTLTEAINSFHNKKPIKNEKRKWRKQAK